MSSVHRRGFLKTSAAGIGGALAASTGAAADRAAGADRDPRVSPSPAGPIATRPADAEEDAPSSGLGRLSRPIKAEKRGQEERDGYVLE